jgi:hypothetical protein
MGTALIIGADKAISEKSFPKPRVFLGLAVSYILLGFLVELAPELAVMFAALIFIAVALQKGPRVFAGVSKALH